MSRLGNEIELARLGRALKSLQRVVLRGRHLLFFDVAATAVNTPSPTGLGNGARFHAVPFQCKISGLSKPPTAHAFAADVAIPHGANLRVPFRPSSRRTAERVDGETAARERCP